MVQNRNTDSLVTSRHPAMRYSVVFIPPTPTPLVAPRNLAPAGENNLRLLSLRCWCSAARLRECRRVRFVRNGPALSGRVSQAPVDSIVSVHERGGKVSAVSVCSIDMGGCTPSLNCSVIAIFSPRWLTSFSPFTRQLRGAHIAGRYDGF